MAKRKKGVAGVAGLDRQIKSTRAKISAVNKKKSAEKAARRKAATLSKLKNKYKSLTGRKK